MIKRARILRAPTERTWSWAPYKKKREVADFPPLRVLFCGSDSFSVPTFDMLREMHLRRADIVSRLGVITPIDKLSGRGMRVRRAAPMTILAKRMGFTVNHVDEFNLRLKHIPEGEWDLIIAVSFGHKITSEVLESMKSGGLNIHPSLLPRYRGPAPLHHALLNGDSETGVSVQTLHPTQFDKGQVLMQSPTIPLAGMNFTGLHSTTARIGASMLKELLLRGYPINAPLAIDPQYEESYAGKVGNNEMRIDWQTWTAAKIQLWCSVLGSLWTELQNARVKLYDLQIFSNDKESLDKPGTIKIMQEAASIDGSSTARPVMAIACSDGWIKVGRYTIAGKKEKSGSDATKLDGSFLK